MMTKGMQVAINTCEQAVAVKTSRRKTATKKVAPKSTFTIVVVGEKGSPSEVRLRFPKGKAPSVVTITKGKVFLGTPKGTKHERSTEKITEYGYPFFPVVLLCQLKSLVRHLIGRLENIHVPVQLIQAKDDDMSSAKNSQFIYKRVRSETKEIVMLYDSYHCITADQERKTVTTKIEEFFSKIHNGAEK